MNRRVLLLVFILLLVLIAVLLFTKPPGQTAEAPEKKPIAETPQMIIYASIGPVEYLVQRIGGDHIIARTLVGPNSNPETFAVNLSQLQALDNAKLYFHLNFPFEQQLQKKLTPLAPQLQWIDLTTGLKLRQMEKHHHPHENAHRSLKQQPQAEQADGHHHGLPDPHVWLSPVNAITMARTIYDTLSKTDPDHSISYQRQLVQLVHELEQLDKALSQQLAPYKGRAILVGHPAYGYFTDRYQLRQIPIEWEGKEPTAKQLQHIVEEAKQLKIHTIFVQPQFNDHNARVIVKEIEGNLGILDPLAADYIPNLREIGTILATTFAAEQ